MKKIIKIIAASTLILSVGCSKSYFNINDNPNVAASSTPELVLPNALVVSAAGNITQYQFVNEYMAYWAPSGSYAQASNDIASYTMTANSGYGSWESRYNNLEDYQFVQDKAVAQNKPFYSAAAIIMKAFVYQQLVDCFNNVPYSQALQGTTFIQPKYDTAQRVYESLSTSLGTAARMMLLPSAVGTATSDVMFGGNALKWAKFANTLRLRLLMHQTEMSGRSSYIQTEINDIISNGAGFITADASVNPAYAANTGQQSPFWGFCINVAGTYTQDFWRANAYPIAFGIANNDPRYRFLYAPNSAGNWVGNTIGSPVNSVGSIASVFGSGVLKSVSQPAVMISVSESYLLQAEAGLRGFIANSPQSLFDQAVQASFTYLNAGSSAAYTSQAGNKQTNYAACTNFAERLACIMRQKWMAFNTVTPMEAWSDYRRLGLPADIPLTQSVFVDVLKIPYRCLYPQTEFNTNLANVNAQGNINHHTSKIFWMP